MKKYLAIVNPISGVKGKETVMKSLSESFNRADERLYFAFTTGEGSAESLTKEAINEGYEAVIAIGGDGTINEIARTLYNTPLKLGIIPRGSGNGLARALGIPCQREDEAVRIIRNGQSRSIDTAFANEYPFFCTFGVGFDAAVTKRYTDIPSRGLFAYLSSAIDEYIHFTPQRYQITIEGETFEQRAMLVTCANIEQYGNNAFIAPGALPDDGLIDLVLISPVNILQIPHFVRQLLTKQINRNILAQSFRCQELTLEREQEGDVQIDGESLCMGKKIKIKVAPRSLRVYTP